MVLVTKHDKEKTYSVVGIGKSCSVYAIHDGTRDRFADAPATVKQRFKTTDSLRTYMEASSSSKVFAIIVDSYVSKGVTDYELSGVKMRVGYGKGHVEEIPKIGIVKSDAEKFFGTAIPSKSESSTTAGTTEVTGQNQFISLKVGLVQKISVSRID